MKKIIGIFICTLLISTAIPALGTTNIEKTDNISFEPKSASVEVVWSDNFDSYSLGQFLDGTSDDGGWKGWNNDSAYGAYVIDDQALSGPHSVDIVGDSDLLQEFIGICSGTWIFSCWMYIPTDFSGKSYFYMMSYYKDNIPSGNLRYQFVLSFNSQSGVVKSEGNGPTLPLIMGQWVEIRVEIDLDADWFECYYNDELLDEKNWTAGSFNQNDGYFNLNSVHMWAYGNNPNSVYFDDFSLEGEAGPIPNLVCDGDLNWDEVKPGETVNGEFTVENIGNSVVDWNITAYPVWGSNWTFNPFSGRLRSEDDPVTVKVSCVAPDEKNKKFTGMIKVINIFNPDDYCQIDISLATPKNKAFNFNFPLLSWLFERFPNVFLVLRYLVGL